MVAQVAHPAHPALAEADRLAVKKRAQIVRRDHANLGKREMAVTLLHHHALLAPRRGAHARPREMRANRLSNPAKSDPSLQISHGKNARADLLPLPPGLKEKIRIGQVVVTQERRARSVLVPAPRIVNASLGKNEKREIQKQRRERLGHANQMSRELKHLSSEHLALIGTVIVPHHAHAQSALKHHVSLGKSVRAGRPAAMHVLQLGKVKEISRDEQIVVGRP